MKVQIVVDTEKDDLAELRKLSTWVNELIEQREKNTGSTVTVTPELPKPEFAQPKPQPRPVESGRTAGGSSVIPYEDMSELLGKIASGEKLR